MADLRGDTITTRVAVRTKRLAEVGAELQGVTLSAFAADAIRRHIRRTLGRDADRNAYMVPGESKAKDEGCDTHLPNARIRGARE